MYQTIDEAKAAAEANPQGNYHVYVYQLDGQYDLHWHFEDRYVFSFLPFGAKIVCHARIDFDVSRGRWDRHLTWDDRTSNFTQTEHDIFRDVLGDEKGDIFWNMINDED